MGRLQSVQTLRALAASLVIVCHAYEPAKIGAFGVDIFFVISGFIISRVMADKTPGAFLRDRLLRIYPIYWICAVPTAALALYIGAITLPRTLTSITLWPVFDGFLQPYLVLGWTLSFEMLFYLSMTLVLLDRRFLWILGLGFPVAMAGAFNTGAALLRFIGNPLILEFLLGVVVARLVAASPELRPRLGAAAIVAAVIALTATDATRLYLPLNAFELTAPERSIVWGLPAAVILWGAIQLEGYARGWRLLPYLGDASYSIYLTHGTALFLYTILPWPLRVAGAILLGTAVHRYVEAPLQVAMRRSSALKSVASGPGGDLPNTFGAVRNRLV